MAAELKRKDDDTIILAMHPGEVATYVSYSNECHIEGLTPSSDMSNINVPWTVEGVITPEQSVSCMIDVIQSKGIQHSGTFWTWRNEVSAINLLWLNPRLTPHLQPYPW